MPAALVVKSIVRMNAGRRFAFGPGKAELLERIDAAGSIGEAARTMNMSYMRAWQIVKSLDAFVPEPLVLRTRGGSANGGASLSETGRAVLAAYREMEAAAESAALAASGGLVRLLSAHSRRVHDKHQNLS